MKHLLEDLKAVREKINSGWTQGAFARGAEGQSLTVFSYKATCWCLSGAVVIAASTSPQVFGDVEREADTHEALIAQIPASELPPDDKHGYRHPIPYFNDKPGRTQAEVLALVDRAIAAEEARLAAAGATNA